MQETENFYVLLCFSDLEDDQIITMYEPSSFRPSVHDTAAVGKLCQTHSYVH
jgi:hypothetical protein